MTLSNDPEQNDTLHKDTERNDIFQNDTLHKDTERNDIFQNDTKQNDTQNNNKRWISVQQNVNVVLSIAI